MARIFKDVNGESHNLDELIQKRNVIIDFEIDILTGERVKYFVGYLDNNGMLEKDKIIEITEDYYNAICTICENLTNQRNGIF